MASGAVMSLADWLCLISPSLSFFFSFPKRRVFSCLKRDFFRPVEETRNKKDWFAWISRIRVWRHKKICL